MGTLKFVGGTSSLTNEVSTQSHIQNLLAGNLSQAQVDSQVNTRLTAYATKTYVDTQDAKLADSAFIDAADSTRLAKSNLNKPGYPFTLDSDGKVPKGKIKVSSLQKYPNDTAGGAGGGGTTSSEIGLLSIPVADPGYAYKLLVTGTVSASVASDNGSFPQVIVSRGDGAVVAAGYGIAEAYQSPALGSASSRMYVAAPFIPTAYPNTKIIPAPFLNASVTYTTDWQNLSFVGVNTSPYTTTMSGISYMEAGSDMSGVTLAASMSFANGVIPNDALFDNIGKLTAEIRIFSSTRGVIVASAPSTGRQVSGTLTASTSTPITVSRGELFTVQVKQTVYCPWGTASLGSYATWAPASSGVSNTLTLTPGLAPGMSGGEVTVLPTALSGQSAITGPTSLSVRLQSPGGTSVTALSSPAPRLMAIPIPA